MRWTIRRQLTALGAGPIAVVVLVCAVGLFGLSTLAKQAAEINLSGKAMQSHMEADMMHDALRGDVFAALLASKPAEHQQVLADVAEHAGSFRAAVAENEKRSLGEDVQKAFRSIHPNLDAYIASAEEIAKLSTTNPAEAQRRLPEFLEAFKALEADMEAVSEKVAGYVDATEKHASDASRWASVLMLAIGLVGALALVAVSMAVVRSVMARLEGAVKAMREVGSGEGDLTRQLREDGADELTELAKSFNHFLRHMHDLVAAVRTNAERVAQASHELQGASGTIASGAQTQASSLEETSATLQQMTSTVRQNADNAAQANQLADGARQVAEKGGRVVGDAVNAMREIHDSSKKIADITTTIDEIAFQTNLLALNAAVEAARAGEQGRGFAVVASEVRGLAQRSASAAREIKGLIDDSVKKVEGGAELVNRSGATLTEIVASVKRVTDIVAEIAAASREQSTGVDEVNKAVGQMDRATQANAAQTEELSATANHLSDQAREVLQIVQRFRLAEGAVKSGVPATRTSRHAPRPIESHPQHTNAPAHAHVTAATGTDGFEEF